MVRVWLLDGITGQWRVGAIHLPQYASFRMEGPDSSSPSFSQVYFLPKTGGGLRVVQTMVP